MSADELHEPPVAAAPSALETNNAVVASDWCSTDAVEDVGLIVLRLVVWMIAITLLSGGVAGLVFEPAVRHALLGLFGV